MIVSYAAKKMRRDMSDPGMIKSQRHDAVLNELMMGPDAEHLIDRIQALLSLLRGQMIPEVVGDLAETYKQEITDFNKLLEVIRDATQKE